MHKIENMPLQTSSIFSRHWQMSQSACFSSKILYVVIFWQEAACVLKARGLPRGWQMPGPRAAQNLQMPHPRDWQRENWSTSKGGPVFSKLFRLDRTDPLSFGPKFPEILVEWIAPSKCPGARLDLTVNFHHEHFIAPTNCPWVSEDGTNLKKVRKKFRNRQEKQQWASWRKQWL